MHMPDFMAIKAFHILLDASGLSKELLRDESLIKRMLEELPGVIGMQVMLGPSLVVDTDPKHPGVTGFVIISYSHISIHTFSETGQIFVDIFSCQPFDYERARSYLCGQLGVAPDAISYKEVRHLV